MARVLLVGKASPDRGGISAYLHDLLAGDLSRSHELSLLNLTREGSPEGGRLTPGNVTRTISDARRVWRASREVDIVHVHSALSPHVTLLRAGFLALAGRLRGARTIVHAHGGRVELWLTTRARRLLASLALGPVDRVVTVSRGGWSALARAVPRDKLVMIENGIDPSAFGPPEPPHDPPRVLYAGVITPRKGLLDLLRASELLTGRGVDHQLLLAGGIPDEGPHAEQEVHRAAGPMARFLGPVAREDMADLYRSADVFCLPSWWEAMPLSLLEAMATGLPVVASRVGDIQRAVEDGVSGTLVSPRQPEHLADALEFVLTRPELRAGMGRAGRERIRSRFGASRTWVALDALYLELRSRR